MHDDDATFPLLEMEPVRPLLGRYRVGPLIGRGGSGQVHRGHDVLADRPVALKFVSIRRDAHAFQVRRELTALRRLRLPGVAQLLDDVVDGDQHVIVSELVDGGPFQPEDAWPAWRDNLIHLLQTLARVHRAGVLHLDLKPANILLDRAGLPTLVDFGLAQGRAMRDEGPLAAGTPRYMAPEQRRGSLTDVRTDLYAIGRMLQEWTQDPTMLALAEEMASAELDDRPASVDVVLARLGADTDQERLAARPLPLGPALVGILAKPGERYTRMAEEASQRLTDPLDWLARGALRFEGERVVLDHIPPIEVDDFDRAVARAERHLDEGALRLAQESLDGSVALEEDASAASVLAAHTVRVRLALAAETGQALARCRYFLDRSPLDGEAYRRLTTLVDAARAFYGGDAETSASLLNGLDALADEDLERRRVGLSLLLAAREGREREPMLEALEDWAAVSPLRAASLSSWWGQLRYAQGRWDDAAELHERAARARRSHERALSLVHAAAAHLERPDLVAAQRLAEEAYRLALGCRHARFAAVADWMARTARYRAGEVWTPDAERVADARAVGLSEGARMGLVEASVARRQGDPRQATLALQSEADFRRLGHRAPAAMARALAIEAGLALTPIVDGLRPQTALQVRALVGMDVSMFADAFPVDRPLDVLTVAECFGWPTR